MSEQPEHVEPLWSRVDDLAERHESFNGVLGLHSAHLGMVRRTLDDLSREMADRFHGATSTLGNLNDRIHALEAQVSRVIDLVAYQAQPDGGPVADDLTIERMEALEMVIDYIGKNTSIDDYGMSRLCFVLQVWLDELSDPVEPAPALDLDEAVYRHLSGYLTPYFVEPSIRRIATEIVALTRAEVTS